MEQCSHASFSHRHGHPSSSLSLPPCLFGHQCRLHARRSSLSFPMDIHPRGGHRRHHSSSFSFFRPPPAPSFLSSRSTRIHGGHSRIDEPSSPRVGCTGQIKRSKTAPRSAAPAGKTGHESKQLLLPIKLARIFSWRRRASRIGRKSCAATEAMISVVDLDPPLPVAKHAARNSDQVSLWNRRCGGEGLKRLQLQEQKLQHRQCAHLPGA